MENVIKKRKQSGNSFRQIRNKRLLAESAKSTKTIQSFFKQTETSDSRNEDNELEDSQPIEASRASTSSEIEPLFDLEPLPEKEVENGTRMKVSTSSTQEFFHSSLKNRDIGAFRNLSIDDATKKTLIEEGFWQPEIGYQFPKCPKNNRSFQYTWLGRFPWLAYSELKGGAYCKYCILFAPECVNFQQNRLQSLISEPYTRYKHAVEDFAKHANTAYHKNAVSSCSNFISCMRGETLSIIKQVDHHRATEVAKNRSILKSIIKTILFCGRQELALRAHRDFGPFEDVPVGNEGNFRAALRFRIDAGDEILKNHLKCMPANATYISWRTQNAVIEEIGEYISENLIKEIAIAEYFSILVDETTDCSTEEQMSLSIRYIFNGRLYEKFLAFIKLRDCSASNVAKVILEALDEKGIDKAKMRGQGYDGCSVMSGHVKGVQAIIREVCPTAIYTHCASHVLNLVINDACNITAIRNAQGTLKEICSFFGASAKRICKLEKSISEVCANSSHARLKSLCTTRWVQRHEAVNIFLELFPAVVLALEILGEDKDRETSQKATSYLASICNGQFVIALLAMRRASSLLLPVSKELQLNSIEIIQVIDLIKDVKKCFEEIRGEAEEEFSKIFKRALTLSAEHDFEIKIPRQARKQIYRENYDSNNAETYYRTTIFIPYIDQLIGEIERRFQKNVEIATKLENLLPTHCCEKSFEEITEAISMYSADLSSDIDIIKAEFELWKKKWEKIELDQRPKTAVHTLGWGPEISLLFPNLSKLLNIFGVLPVTTATPERTFSTLRRVKTYMRSTMSENRLTGLAMMSIHRDKDIDLDIIIDRLAARKTRRLNFIL